MVNQKVLGYLKEGKRRGFAIRLLRQKLLEARFSNKVVDEAIIYLKQEESKLSKKQVKVPASTPSATKPKRQIPSAKTVQKPVIRKQVNVQGMDLEIKSFKKIGKVLAHPTELFNRTKSEGIGGALKYYLFVGIFNFIWLLVIALLFLHFSSGMLGSFELMPGIGSSLITNGLTTNSILLAVLFVAIIVFILYPMTFFISSGILHLFIKLFKGQGNYAGTFKAGVYSLTPTMLFGFIPIMPLWSFILSLFGLSIYHNISKLRVFLVMLVISVLFSVIPTLILLLIGS